MSNKSDKNKQAELERQAAEDRRRAEEDRKARDILIAQAVTPKPLETAREKESLDWIAATQAKDVDVTKLPGMGTSWGLYDSAVNKQQGERMGLGALQLGQAGQNPMLAQLLKSQQDAERQQGAAGQFENAYRMKDAEMRGSVMPLLGLQQNRTMGLASLGSGNYSNAAGQAGQSSQTWANFRPAPSFWQQLLMSGISGASQVGAAYMGRPPGR